MEKKKEKTQATINYFAIDGAKGKVTRSCVMDVYAKYLDDTTAEKKYITAGDLKAARDLSKNGYIYLETVTIKAVMSAKDFILNAAFENEKNVEDGGNHND